MSSLSSVSRPRVAAAGPVCSFTLPSSLSQHLRSPSVLKPKPSASKFFSIAGNAGPLSFQAMVLGMLAHLALAFVLTPAAHGEQELLLDRPAHRMDMTVAVHPGVAVLGDTISIVISAMNREQESVRLLFGPKRPFAFRVTGPDGNPVKVQRGSWPVTSPFDLAPGETVHDTFEVVLAPLSPPDSSLYPLRWSTGAGPHHRVLFVPLGTTVDPWRVIPPTVEWPIWQGRIAAGTYLIEGGILGQEFRWAAGELIVR